MKLNKLFNNRNNNKKGKNKLTGDKVFKIDGYSLADIQSFVEVVRLDDKDLQRLRAAALTLVMLVQLKYSTTEAAGLPSTKYYKKKVITATPSVVWCTIISAYKTYDLLGVSLTDILEAFIGDPILPTKKVNKVTKDNCTEFFKSRRSSILGSLNTCPATQTAYFNLDSNCVNSSVDAALNLIFPNSFPARITKENIFTVLMELILTAGNDNKMAELSFAEPKNINSKIVRNNKVDTSLKQNGSLSESRLTNEILQQVFSSSELRRYRVAWRFGDKSTLKQLNELAKTRLEETAKPKDDTAPAEPTATFDGLSSVQGDLQAHILSEGETVYSVSTQ